MVIQYCVITLSFVIKYANIVRDTCNSFLYSDMKEAVQGLGKLKLYMTGTNNRSDPSIICLDPLLEQSSKFNPPNVPGSFSGTLMTYMMTYVVDILS